MASSNNIFHGQAAFEPGLHVKPHAFQAKPFDEDYDVEIKITHCGICGSDLHTISGGWGPIKFPLVAVDGYTTQGGYADYYRCHAKFVVPIPDGLSSESAAPMLCAGITTYSPLKAHGAGPGKKVGVVGIGGLGHLGIQWAVALGAQVTALSSSDKKESECKELLRAHHLLNYSDVDAVKAYAQSFDILLCTSYGPTTDWDMLLNLVVTAGTFVPPRSPFRFERSRSCHVRLRLWAR